MVEQRARRPTADCVCPTRPGIPRLEGVPISGGSMSEVPSDGMNRRDVLKRGAMVGGALVWTAPVVQSLAGPAMASAVGSQAPELCGFNLTITTDTGSTG